MLGINNNDNEPLFLLLRGKIQSNKKCYYCNTGYNKIGGWYEVLRIFQRKGLIADQIQDRRDHHWKNILIPAEVAINDFFRSHPSLCAVQKTL